MKPKVYVLENSNYDGYSQQFSKIGNWRDVLKWATDGSMKAGDVVHELKECRQPKISVTP